MENLTIKAWAEADRPREKLLDKGRQALSEAELIAILIGSGNQDESAVDLGKRILHSIGSDLAELGKLSVPDLMKFKGIGEAKAVAIVAALELGRRRADTHPSGRVQVITSADAFACLKSVFSDLVHEEFWILLLNRANKILRKEFLSRGGLHSTVIDPRMVFKPALQYHASYVILSHNHPSGNLKPSEQDLKITQTLKDSGKLLEIPVLDHLIIANEQYYSFADHELM